MRGDRVYIADSAAGNRSMSVKDFEKNWNGVILVVVSKKGQTFSDLPLTSAMSAPMMNVIRVQQMGMGTFSFFKAQGEF